MMIPKVLTHMSNDKSGMRFICICIESKYIIWSGFNYVTKAKCYNGQMLPRQNVTTAKCYHGKCYNGKMLSRQNVTEAKCYKGKMLSRQNLP